MKHRLPTCSACQVGEQDHPCRTNGRLDYDKVARAFLDNYRATFASTTSIAESKAPIWSFECLSNMCRVAPETALDIILEAIPLCSNDAERAYLAASVLEELIAENGAAVIEEIEKLAWRDAALRDILQGVWSQGSEGSDIWNRVLRARQGRKPYWMRH